MSSPSFTTNVATIVTGTAIAQIIAILATPFITRFYGPEAFGLFALFSSVAGIFTIIACLRYEPAIMLPKTDEGAANVFGLCILILLVITLISIPVFMVCQQPLEQFLNAPQLGQFIWLIPPTILFTGAFLALNSWNTRTKQFKRLAITRVMKSFSTTGIQLGIGFAGFASGGVLIGASVIGQLVATAVLGLQIMRDHLSFFKRNITIKGMIAALKEYSNFPKFDIWSAMLNNFSGMLPVFILSIYFNSAVLGFYSLGLMVLTLPLSLISDAVAQVFFQSAAEAKNISQEKLKETVERTIKPLIFLCFFPTLLLVLIGPQLFGVVFGSAWLEAGNYARYLSVWMFIVLIDAPMSTLFVIFQKQKLNLVLNIVQMGARIVGLMIGAMLGNALLAIILFALAGIITNLISVVYLLRLTELSILIPARILSKYLLLSVPFISIIVVIQQIPLINNLALVIFSSILAIIYYVLAMKNDPDLLDPLKKITSRIPIINKILN
jgi:O-antigen/teichoic acid export membrane protein